ncbi:MAG: T9SS type A sorting domain-containing protein [Bacteroidetes bacterium]|nr:T9SS type A sorting domain-containing protein [Bacteroidota bacterium]
MKKILLLIFSVTVSVAMFSQNLSLSTEQGPIPPNGSIMVIGDPGDDQIIAHVYVTNNGTASIDVKVFRRQNVIQPNAWSQFCWWVCYSGETDTSGFFVTIDPGVTDTSDFSGHYHPEGTPGISSVTYVFYDVNNMSDSTSVTVEYNASPAGIFDELIKAVALSNVYPNPANRVAFIDYSLPEELFKAKLAVNNLLGATIMEIDLYAAENRIKINTEELKNGIYFCSLKVNNQVISTKRLIVNH